MTNTPEPADTPAVPFSEPLLQRMKSLAAQAHNAGPSADPGTEKPKTELGGLLEIWSKRHHDDAAWCGSPEPYRYLAARFLKLGAAPQAKEVARTALEYQIRLADRTSKRPWADDIELCLTFGLALARTSNPEQAQQVLGGIHDRLKMDRERPLDKTEKQIWEETLGMLGRTYKDQSMQAVESAVKQDRWQKSLEHYDRAYRLTGGYWTGINVATLARLSGDDSRAVRVAGDVRDQCLTKLQGVVPGDDDQYWVPATLGEAALVLGEFGEAERYYRRAYQAAPGNFGNLNSTRRHARWLLEHWQQDVKQLDAWLPIPQVVVFAGHMIDKDGRSPERFPGRLASSVKAAIKDWLQRHNALVGFSSVACGADILFQEALRELGGECRVILPYHEKEFLIDSVDFISGADWKDRFAEVMQNAIQVVRASNTRLQFGSVAYDFASQVLHGLALRRAAELETPLLGLTVWDGKPGDGPGGTATTVAHWRERGLPVSRVDLSQLPGEGGLPLPVIEDECPVRAAVTPVPQASSLEPTKGAITGPVDHRGSRVTALLFADAVGFSDLPDAEVSLFVREFLGRIATLLSDFEKQLPSNPSGLPIAAAMQSPMAGEPFWETPLGRRCPVRETWGDGLFLAFPSLYDAGEFALQVTALMRDTDWLSLGFSRKLSLRVALHAGPIYPGIDPITHLPKAIGSHVSRAARLEPKTPSGEIYASEAFAALLALAGESGFACDYVKQLEWAKHYGTFPTYVVRRCTQLRPSLVRENIDRRLTFNSETLEMPSQN